MSKDVVINIVNAHVLDPDKKYLLELPHSAYSMGDANHLANALKELNVNGIVAIKRGHASIKIHELTEEK